MAKKEIPHFCFICEKHERYYKLKGNKTKDMSRQISSITNSDFDSFLSRNSHISYGVCRTCTSKVESAFELVELLNCRINADTGQETSTRPKRLSKNPITPEKKDMSGSNENTKTSVKSRLSLDVKPPPTQRDPFEFPTLNEHLEIKQCGSKKDCAAIVQSKTSENSFSKVLGIQGDKEMKSKCTSQNVTNQRSEDSSTSASPVRRGRGRGGRGRGRSRSASRSRSSSRVRIEGRRQQIQERESEEEILERQQREMKAEVQTMSKEKLQETLCKAIDLQPGIMLDVMKPVVCREMLTVVEKKCCQKMHCVSNQAFTEEKLGSATKTELDVQFENFDWHLGQEKLQRGRKSKVKSSDDCKPPPLPQKTVDWSDNNRPQPEQVQLPKGQQKGGGRKPDECSDDDDDGAKKGGRKLKAATTAAVSEHTVPNYPSITFHNPTGISSEDKFKSFCEENFNTDLIAVCETFFTESENRTYNDRFEGYFCNRVSARGGCAIWIKKSLCSCRKKVFTYMGDGSFVMEALCVMFTYDEREKFAVLVIYNPPSKSKELNRSKYNTMLVNKMFTETEAYAIPNYNYIVMGDFNRTTLGTERQLKGFSFYDYSEAISELDRVYGTHPYPFPYTVSPVDPVHYNRKHKEKTKLMHRIIKLLPNENVNKNIPFTIQSTLVTSTESCNDDNGDSSALSNFPICDIFNKESRSSSAGPPKD